MYCEKCGTESTPDAKFCSSCGAPVSAMPAIGSVAVQDAAKEQGRGATILVLGILSLLLIGPILGIVAWVMGNKDLKKINSGKILPDERGTTLAGMVLGIIGTFISPVTALLVIGLIVGTTIFTVRAQSASLRQADADQTIGAPVSLDSGLAVFDGIEQMRGQTTDDPPAIFLLVINIVYDKQDHDIGAILEIRRRQIEDIVLKKVSSKKAVELAPKYYSALQKELLEAINNRLKPNRIASVIFRQFVVQQ